MILGLYHIHSQPSQDEGNDVGQRLGTVAALSEIVELLTQGFGLLGSGFGRKLLDQGGEVLAHLVGSGVVLGMEFEQFT